MTALAPTDISAPFLRFATARSLESWRVIGDRVMGGLSTAAMSHHPDGHAVFAGTVSLANGGGFASVRAAIAAPAGDDVSAYLLTIRGDGKRYRFSVRMGSEFDGVGYQAAFAGPAGEWTLVRLDLGDFVPTWRGRVVAGAPPLVAARVQQVGLLIGDRQAGAFRLELRAIDLATRR